MLTATPSEMSTHTQGTGMALYTPDTFELAMVTAR